MTGIEAFVWGVGAGMLLTIVGAFLYVRFSLSETRKRPCSACGRVASVIAQVADLETGRTLAVSLLCHACMTHVRHITAASPAPWAHNWKA
jgi:hypothetical protein